MKRTTLGLAGLTILAALMADMHNGAKAQWCAYYEPTIYNCGFRTFSQCVANISGVGGLCSPDRRFVEPRATQDAPRARKRKAPAKAGAR